MENKYEDALNEVTDFSKEQEDGSVCVCVSGENYETIRSALKLAQEAEQLRLKLSETAIHLAARNSEIEQLRKERDELAGEVLSVINQSLCFPSKKEGTNCITLDAYKALDRLRDKLRAKKVVGE